MIKIATEKERAGVYKTMGYCFNWSEDAIKNNIESGSFNKYEEFIVSLNDKEDVESVFAIIPYDVYFEGKIVRFGGIGGVSSLPENRGAGNIRKMFKFSFEYMKEHNMIFSGLGPFAFQYYRKFGYEWCFTWQLVNIPINDLKDFPAASSYRQLKKEDKELFENFRNHINERVNGPVVRDERLANEKWDYYRNTNHKVYGAFNDKNELVSMMAFKQEGKEIKVAEMYFEDELSRQYLLNFLYRHRSMTEKVELVLHVDDEIRNILPSPRISYWHWPNKMGRVVLVEEALKLLNIKNSFDNFSIKINDDLAPWNNQTFNVSCVNDKVNVSCDNSLADFEMDINRFSQLIYGHIDATQAIKLNFVKINNKTRIRDFEKLFYKKTTMLWQEF